MPRPQMDSRQPGATLFVLLALLAALSFPGRAEPVWANGQGARMVVGQPSFTRQAPVSSRQTIGSAAGVAVAGNRLFIADGNKMGAVPNNNRVLIYNNLSSFIIDPEQEPAPGTVCPVCVGLPDVVLGQDDFESFGPSLGDGLQAPTGVASDGVRLAVADANNNRVLIWNTIPAVNGTPPDSVVGQPDFETNKPATSSTGMRGPQGVWIDGNRLFVADTQNGRVLVYNSVPTSNGVAANVVLGQPDFDTRPEPDLTQSNVQPTPAGMLDPVAVTVNNGRLFVTDLAFNRVMIYFTVPTQNNFPADVAVGQPDLESGVNNNSRELCDPLPVVGDNDADGDGEDDGPTFPRRCEATLSFPRFALSDGARLYIADGGNDRVLIFDEIPMAHGARANQVIGQQGFQTLEESDGAGSLRAPSSLAFDGQNLYVADPFSRRILVFTPAEDMIFQDGLRNAASIIIPSQGFVTFEGNPAVGDEISITISQTEYAHAIEEGQNLIVARDSLMAQINDDPQGVAFATPMVGPGDHADATIRFSGATRVGDMVRLQVGDQVYEHTVAPEDSVTDMVDIFNFFITRRPDPNVASQRDPADIDTLLLTAREVGPAGNAISLSFSAPPDTPLMFELSGNMLEGGSIPYGVRLVAREPGRSGDNITIDTMSPSAITVDRSGARLVGGSDASELPAGTVASIFGSGFAAEVIPVRLEQNRLPTEVGGVRVYVNGVRAPLYYVGPDQINFQVPFDVAGTSLSAYVWRRTEEGVMVSAARATPVTRAAPGLFAFPGPEPRRGIAVHAAGPAQGTIGISATTGGTTDSDAAVAAGVTATINVNGRNYTYTTQEGDTAAVVRDRLVAAINAAEGDPEVFATAGQEGFFSARATIDLGGEIEAGNVVQVQIRDRLYIQVVVEGDSLVSVRNKLVEQINAGQGDREVTARRLEAVGTVQFQIVARSLGDDGNDIPFALSVSENAKITATTEADEGVLEGGQTPPVVTLTARVAGQLGNQITYSSNSSDTNILMATSRSVSLCCGNEPFSLITDENPAVPGETVVLFGSGLGLTAPLPQAQDLQAGEITPGEPLFNVPAVAEDFVSSLAGGRTATVEFVGLMPGEVGVYQINLRLNTDLPDNPAMPLDIRQVLFFSNAVTIPVKNLRPRRDL